MTEKSQPSPSSSFHGKELNHIVNLFEKTIKAGESNSALLIGPRGCGKTTVIFKQIALIYYFIIILFLAHK